MPRLALPKVSTATLQAELQRRVATLGKLLKLKEQVDKDIAGLQALAGQFGKAVGAEAPAVKVRRRRGRKARTVKVVIAKAPARKPRKAFKQTAQKFILRLLKAGTMTSAELNDRWERIGRPGRPDNTLHGLFKAGKIKREKIAGAKGSKYNLA